MRLNELNLYGFRNYEELHCPFVKDVNLIVGRNAQGKTNLLEAIVYLSMGRSFRTRKEAELIGFAHDFAELSAQVYTQQREQQIRAVMFAGRRPRQLYLNGVKKKSAAELAGLLPTVLFCPEDLQVLKAGAAGRRKWLDFALCQLRPNYAAAAEEYQRLLEQKSRILKDRFEHPGLMEVLPEYNLRLAQVGAQVISYRARYLRALDRHAAAFHNEFSGSAETLTLVYRTVSTITDPFAPVQTLVEQVLAHQQTHARAELESCQCLTGPHKDDFDALLNGRSLKSFGSQGQVRTAAISLKLAQREIVHEDTKQNPILLLDDVLSELDVSRQDFVLNKIQNGQVFITCCEQDKWTNIGQVITIEDGRRIDGP